MKAEDLIVDNRWERELTNPKTFPGLSKEVDELIASDIGQKLGTIAIDGMTGLGGCCVEHVLEQEKQTNMRIQDWGVMLRKMLPVVKKFLTIKCTKVLIAHLQYTEQKGTEEVIAQMLVGGATKTHTPALFDEVYVTVTKDTSKGPEYKLLTCNRGMYRARTRIGGHGVFDMYEEPNICKLIEKSGRRVINRV